MSIPIIILADDDPDDRLMASEAAEDTGILDNLITVDDGAELLDRLLGRGQYVEEGPVAPALVLLDLNMPRKDGREALAEIRANPTLRRLPVVVLTTSNAPEDIAATYDLGVNSFIVKPDSYSGLVDVMESVRSYWLNTVELPVA